VLAPGQRQVEAAEAALAAHDARGAIASAQATSEMAQQLSDAIGQYRDMRSEIVRLRGEAEALETRGYRMEASHGALNDARTALAATAAALQRGELAAGPFDTARHALERAAANGQGLVALEQQNAERLEELRRRGEAVAALIGEGRQAFDAVDEFAESTWSDIRGNGSEAQRAADEAHDAWDSATERNTMERQEFAAARDDLNAAEASLGRATELVNAILQRLRDLEAARAGAAAEIAAARADIEAGRAFVRSNDPDISPSPDELLARAESQLAAAEAEAARPKPDWLALLRQAQAANADADAALADARSEAETIAKLRGEAERARQAAAAEVQKTAQFLSIHSVDLRQPSRDAVAGLQQLLARAEATARAAEAAEDQARARALQQGIADFARVDQQAERVYGEIYNEFSQIDKLRDTLERERRRASNALSEAVATLRSYGGGVSTTSEPMRLIERAQAALAGVPSRVEGEASIRQAIAVLEKAVNDARTASAIIRAQYRPPASSSGSDDFGSAIGGAVIGALLEGALRSGGSGGSSHRRSGGGGGGTRWGGGGSGSGGSFGGGSSSGGGWGGGSGSGGGW
jgi:chromosome segregation ATPase